MKTVTFLLSSLIILTPVLAQAEYLPAQSGIERLPHFAQQHYTPHAKTITPAPSVKTEETAPEETSFTDESPKHEDIKEAPSNTYEEEHLVVPEIPASTPVKPTNEVGQVPQIQAPQINTEQSQAPVTTEGFVEVPYTDTDGVIRIDATPAQATPAIYGYSEDGLPITDFSNKVNHYKAQFIEQNPHLFKAKKP